MLHAIEVIKAGHVCSDVDNCLTDALINGDRSTVTPAQRLIHYKALASSMFVSVEFGGLTLPSNDLLDFISKCENIFVNNFDGLAHLLSVRSKLNGKILRD